ncbi:hypothetical protein FKW77_008610 [Venturia effusa]|uniref:CFEM domain-containing protein n=1 Tax=Venturia effusa TaxID=50376 RepID=A0A517LJG7_9PEZI|nr:hypothetical protein FKW77_008610 [Venturia effusa]
MKYSITLLAVLGLNLGSALAQDATMLTAVGFPACAVPCVQAGNKAASEKHGCSLTDIVCQCTTGFKTAQEAVMNCIMSSKSCTEADMGKIATAGTNLCAATTKQGGTSVPANGTAANGTASNGTPANGTAANGTAGTGTAGTDTAGTDTAGTGTAGTGAAGTHTSTAATHDSTSSNSTAAHSASNSTSTSGTKSSGTTPSGTGHANTTTTAKSSGSERTIATGALGLVGAVVVAMI